MPSLASLILWNTGWSAVLAIVVFSISRLIALRRRPALLHLLWFGVLLRLIVPAVIALPVLTDAAATVRVEAGFSNAVPQHLSVEIVPAAAVPQPEQPLPQVSGSRTDWVTVPVVLLAISLCGTFVLLSLSLIRSLRLRRLLEESVEAPPRLGECLQQLCEGMKLAVVPRLRIVNGLATPSIWSGGRHPTILLPQHLLDEFDDDQWSCILAHELAHVVRRDLWFNLVAAGVLHLCWWNPIAWWAWREMRACQEASCDAIALSRRPQSRRRYAETLLKVVESWNRRMLVQPQVLPGFGNRSVLIRRFEMIADSSVRPRTAVLTAVTLAVGMLTFLCLPVRAGRNEPAPDAAENSQRTELEKRLAGTWKWSGFLTSGELTYRDDGSYRFTYDNDPQATQTGTWRVEGLTEIVYVPANSGASSAAESRWRMISVTESELKLQPLSSGTANKTVTYTRAGAKSNKEEPASPLLKPMPAEDGKAADGRKSAEHVLKYDDDKPDGKRSIAGTGEMVRFALPDASQKLTGLRMHCARYGHPQAPNEDVKIYLLDDDMANVVHTEQVPYSAFKRGESRWTAIEFKKPVEVPAEFWVIVDFNAEKTKGVYLSFDTSTEGKHSKTGLPGQEAKPVATGGDWMIQAVLTTK